MIEDPQLPQFTNLRNVPYYGTIETWNTGLVTNMSNLFFNKTTFNDDITKWDTSNVTNMSYMFAGSSVFNQDIGIWNVLQVINMAYMFAAASEFDQNIGNWNVESEKYGFYVCRRCKFQ